MGLEENIWYAINKTNFVRIPKSLLTTFGTTKIDFILVTELVDKLDQLCVRHGTVETEAPQLYVPDKYEIKSLFNFKDKKSQKLLDYMFKQGLFNGLKYGSTIKMKDIKKNIIKLPLKKAIDDLQNKYNSENIAVISGIEEGWELSILKFIDYFTLASLPKNIQDIEQKNKKILMEIEEDFCNACGNIKSIESLGDKLQQHNLFQKYESRFFALLKTVQK